MFGNYLSVNFRKILVFLENVRPERNFVDDLGQSSSFPEEITEA